MTDTYGTAALSTIETPEPESNAPDRPTQNSAVARCLRAWQRAYKKACAEGDSDFKAKCAGDRAFLRSMPALSGYDNIRDFIACVTYAIVIDVLRSKDAEHLLEAAKVALTTLRQQPKPPNGSLSPLPPQKVAN